MKILLAEDTRDLSRAVSAVMSMNGYEVDAVYDGEEALEHIRRDSYDVLVLDIMMPKKDGLEVIREVRAMSINTPALFLTAKTQIDDRVAGLDAGADDYLTKPFAMQELMARIRSMTRRTTRYQAREIVFGSVRLDAEKFELSAENSIVLSNKEFELMHFLMSNPDRDFSTKDLLGRIWDEDPAADPGLVWIYISYLRRKLDSIMSDIEIAGEKGGSFRLRMIGS